MVFVCGTERWDRRVPDVLVEVARAEGTDGLVYCVAAVAEAADSGAFLEGLLYCASYFENLAGVVAAYLLRVRSSGYRGVETEDLLWYPAR